MRALLGLTDDRLRSVLDPRRFVRWIYGGRLILTSAAGPETLLAALAAAGLIHCLVEPQGRLSLYRGERPPEENNGADNAIDRARTPVWHALLARWPHAQL